MERRTKATTASVCFKHQKHYSEVFALSRHSSTVGNEVSATLYVCVCSISALYVCVCSVPFLPPPVGAMCVHFSQ